MRVSFTVWNQTYHSDTDLGIVISSVVVGEPPTKTSVIDIPGSDGALDFSDYFGEPKYGNRVITIECGIRINNRFQQESSIRNAIHGKRCKIVLSEDSEYYYTGRVDVGNIEKQVGVSHFTILCDCLPYKERIAETTKVENLTTTYKDITITNERRQVVPTVTVTEETTIRVGDETKSVSAGTHKLLLLTLGAGGLTFSAKVTSGTGRITVRYREASL